MGKMGDTWRGMETSTRTCETDQGVTVQAFIHCVKEVNSSQGQIPASAYLDMMALVPLCGWTIRIRVVCWRPDLSGDVHIEIILYCIPEIETSSWSCFNHTLKIPSPSVTGLWTAVHGTAVEHHLWNDFRPREIWKTRWMNSLSD